jgi:cell division protein FtsI/penicillin-binding protein 2
MTQKSRLSYNGRPYTLYKSQLKKAHNRYTRYLTLQEAFAKSINPVFGKLGIDPLGKENLAKYAQMFAFNQPIPWELPLPASHFSITEERYHWAEIASGFNQNTTLSPLHGALITAAVVNQGTLWVPNLVEMLSDHEDQVVYRAQPIPLKQTISPATAEMLTAMMEATVTSGTGRKAFRGYRKDAVLSRLRLGGKTGSINNDPRYDWFVGFARDEQGPEQLVVAALVGHEKYIGLRAVQYAKLAIKSHFSRYFAAQAENASPLSAPAQHN